MRYNPDTERGLKIEDIAAQCRPSSTTPSPYPQPEKVWDCQNGHWIANPEATESLSRDEELEGAATLALWSARYKLQQIKAGSIPAATVESIRRDVYDIAREVQRLSV